jgi:hypothetical protein
VDAQPPHSLHHQHHHLHHPAVLTQRSQALPGPPKQRQAPVLSLATGSSAQLHAGPDETNTMEPFCHAVAQESMSNVCTYRFIRSSPLCLSAALCCGDFVTVATNYCY